MERLEAIGEWISIAGMLLFVVGGYVTWSYESFGVVTIISIVLCLIGGLIAPPKTWRWGKHPVSIKDPTHERKV